MGKNQQHKARQQAKHTGGAGGGGDAADAGQGVDASFHTAGALAIGAIHMLNMYFNQSMRCLTFTLSP